MVIGDELGLGMPAAAVVGPDGTVFVIDYSQFAVLKVGADGRLLWRAGRKGQGPGEFVRPYRVAATADGGALVYDGSTGEVSTFDSAGRFVAKARLGIWFAQVDAIAGIDSIVVIAGTVRSLSGAPGDAVESSIHVFSASGSRIRSFGPLPIAKDPAVLRFWGAGQLSIDADGALVFVRKIPYEIYRFSLSGRELSRVAVDRRITALPGSRFTTQSVVSGGGLSGTRFGVASGVDVPAPSRAISLSPDHWIAGRVGTRTRTIDVIEKRSGRVIAEGPLPRDWEAVIGFDAARSVLWAIGLRDDAPVLIRQRIRRTVRH